MIIITRTEEEEGSYLNCACARISAHATACKTCPDSDRRSSSNDNDVSTRPSDQKSRQLWKLQRSIQTVFCCLLLGI